MIDGLEITAFSIKDLFVDSAIDEPQKSITLIVPFRIEVTSLIAKFDKAEKSIVTVGVVEQTSGKTPNDFTNPVLYKVTAEDGRVAIYTVTVLVETHANYFEFDSRTGNITGYDIAGGSDVVIPAIINSTAVTGIGDLAFGGCQLTSVFIHDSVTRIGMAPFLNCTKLTRIMVDGSNENYSSFAGVLFNKDQTTLLGCPAGKYGSYVIPDGVTSIGVGAFICNGVDSVLSI